MVEYLARVMPHAEGGGSGNAIWQELVEDVGSNKFIYYYYHS